MSRENDILETTLAIAERGYGEAYHFLLEEYEKNAEDLGAQTLYFLSCLAGGDNRPEDALKWLRKAVNENGWWYRPEVLEDDDLALLGDNTEFKSLRSISDARYAQAVSHAKALFSWEQKTADALFLAVHGNTQNGRTARNDWESALKGNGQWQIETVQSAEPDCWGTYRWSYDMASYRPVASALEKMQNRGYRKIACGGFSAGCDALLRTVLFSSARCDALVLQSPWIPVLEEHGDELIHTLKEKNIALRIFCGDQDEDCLPMAESLYAAAGRGCLDASLSVQENSRHQFSPAPYTLGGL